MWKVIKNSIMGCIIIILPSAAISAEGGCYRGLEFLQMEGYSGDAINKRINEEEVADWAWEAQDLSDPENCHKASITYLLSNGNVVAAEVSLLEHVEVMPGCVEDSSSLNDWIERNIWDATIMTYTTVNEATYCDGQSRRECALTASGTRSCNEGAISGVGHQYRNFSTVDYFKDLGKTKRSH